jgi:Starch-binding associating with outer membrane
MKKMKKIILFALLIGITVVSCENFEGWNIDEKNPSEVSGSFLFTSAQKALAVRMQSTNVNSNIFKMYAQHWTETTYTDEANYDLRNRDIGGNFWSDLFRNVLADLEDAKRVISEDESIEATTKANQIAIANLLQIYTWHILVDTFGDIPYTEALQGNSNIIPKYDDDAAIYVDLFERLDGAIAQLIGGGSSFGDADLIYNGSTAQWLKFANSLKLKMAVRISDFDNGMASLKASEAAAAGVIVTQSDNAAFPFESTTPNTNPLWVDLVQSGRKDFIIANTFVDLIVPLNDPRRHVYMDNNLGDEVYIGGPYGENNTFGNYTHIGELFHTPDFEGLFLSASEVHFLLAEAVERGLISGNAEAHYNAAVTANILYWGLSLSDATTYLAQSTVAYDSANWKKSIGVQKWLSLYARGFEAWASWKLLDYPNTMNRPPVSELPVPRRYIYPLVEPNVNQANYDDATAAMGGDNLDSRVFWDINGQGN